jgi:hypothetical protein
MERILTGFRERPRLTIALAMLLSSLAVYAPFVLSGDMDQVCRYWDGPPYMYVAKTLYRVPAEHPFAEYNLPPSYFANHLPAYPLLIRVLTPLTLGSYPAAMIVATLLTSVGAALLFYELLTQWELVASPLWTAILFCVLPPRWLIYHAVGASEPLFFCCVFAAFLAYRAERPGRVVLFVTIASLTRITGILLVAVFGLRYLERRDWRRMATMALGGVGVLALFGYYRFVYGDFLAYFHWSLDQAGMISLRPLEIFRRYASADKLHSVELFAGLYIVYAIGTLLLWKRRALFWYCAVYFAFCTLITHQDLPRYFLAVAPFALLVAFDPILTAPVARFALPLILYLDYTYAWSFLPRKLVGAGVYERLLQALAAP